MATNIISVLLSFRENLSKNINPAITALNKFDARVETLRNVMAPLSASAGLFLAGSAKAAADFAGALKEAKKGLGLTNEELEAFGNQAKTISENLNFQVGSTQILGLATASGKLGVAKEDLAAYTENLVKFAVANDKLDSIEQLNENVAKINSVFRMGVEDLADWQGAVSVLADTTSANAQQLTDFTQQIAGTAAASNMSAKSITTFGAALINSGQQSGQAATFMRNFAIKLGAAENQSKGAKAAFEELGWSAKEMAVAFERDAEGTMIKFLERIKELQKIDPVAATRVMASIFGAENLTAGNLMLGQLDKLKESLDAVGDRQANAKKLSDEFAVSSQGLDGALRALKNVAIELAIEVGGTFLPAIVKATQALLEFVKPVLAFVREHPRIAQTVAALLGITAVVAPLLAVAGAISSLLALIPSVITGFTAVAALFSGGLVAAFVGVAAPIAGVVAGATALGLAAKAIYDNWGGISKWFGDLWNQISLTVIGKAMEIKTDLENWGRNTAASIKNIGAEWYKAGQGLIGSFVDGIKSQYSNARDSVSNFTQGIRDFLPGSDAKRGALSDLTNSGMAFADTFMKGVQQRGLAGELNNLFSGYNSNASGIPNLGSGNQGFTTAPVTITYNITARDSDEILKKLKERDRELLQLINQSSNRINRTAY